MRSFGRTVLRSLRVGAGLVRTPIPQEARRVLAEAWARIPPALRGPRQVLGRQYAGCGALIGTLPRCDFACRGCYLGTEANRTPAAPLEEIGRQLRRVREWTGPGGNVQITDGEVTLRDPDELTWIVREARRLGLVPMLMTHGEALRQDPERLRRLMLEAGLADISIHIDTTQRGRRGGGYRRPGSERELHPLRDEFAALIRRLRAETRRPLRAATTVTVTPHNAGEVADVVRWVAAHADAFRMLSFQPVAQVGRTEPGLGGGVDAESVWRGIEAGLADRDSAGAAPSDSQGWLGHPDCSRFVQALVRRSASGRVRHVALFRLGLPGDARVFSGLLERLGGLSLRLDRPARARLRLAAALARHPGFLLGRVLPWLWRLLGRVAPEGRLRFALAWARGQERLDYLNVVSHHFMSAEQLASPRGRERLALCKFRVPVQGELVSMCEVNASGIRDAYYEGLRRAAAGTRAA